MWDDAINDTFTLTSPTHLDPRLVLFMDATGWRSNEWVNEGWRKQGRNWIGCRFSFLFVLCFLHFFLSSVLFSRFFFVLFFFSFSLWVVFLQVCSVSLSSLPFLLLSFVFAPGFKDSSTTQWKGGSSSFLLPLLLLSLFLSPLLPPPSPLLFFFFGLYSPSMIASCSSSYPPGSLFFFLLLSFPFLFVYPFSFFLILILIPFLPFPPLFLGRAHDEGPIPLFFSLSFSFSFSFSFFFSSSSSFFFLRSLSSSSSLPPPPPPPPSPSPSPSSSFFFLFFARDDGHVVHASMRAREHWAEWKITGQTGHRVNQRPGRSWSMSRRNCPEMRSSRVCLRPFFVLSNVLPRQISMISSSGGLWPRPSMNRSRACAYCRHWRRTWMVVSGLPQCGQAGLGTLRLLWSGALRRVQSSRRREGRARTGGGSDRRWWSNSSRMIDVRIKVVEERGLWLFCQHPCDRVKGFEVQPWKMTVMMEMKLFFHFTKFRRRGKSVLGSGGRNKFLFLLSSFSSVCQRALLLPPLTSSLILLW